MGDRLFEDMSSAEMAAKYDTCCKILISNKVVLAYIMKYCIKEFSDFDVNYIANNCIDGTPQISEVAVDRNTLDAPQKITGLNTEDKTQTEGTVYFDIRFVGILPDTDENIRIIINIEAQNNFNPGYSLIKRGLYYCARLVSAQKETEFGKDDYNNIRKVYSIWICTDTPNYAKNTINKYCFKEEHLVGEYEANSDDYDIMNMVMVCLDKDGEDIEKSASELLKLLRVLLSEYIQVDRRKDILNNRFKVDVKDSEVNTMCNLGEGLMQRAMTKGEAKGRALGKSEGIAIGKSEGIDVGKLESIKNIMKNMMWTFEQAATAVGLSDEDKERFAAMV